MLNSEEERHILQTIHDIEQTTSSEIKVHLEKYCEGDVLQRAWEVFELLELHQTQNRNGVLIYIAWKDRKACIWGDEGIHKKVGQDYWNATLSRLIEEFKQEQFVLGIINAIRDIGEKLKVHFPHQLNDKNELTDDISYGD